MPVMMDHPGWENGTRTLTTGQQELVVSVDGLHQTHLPVDTYDPQTLGSRTPPQLLRQFARIGPVTRLRTPNLWEALASAIIRQVIRADQARSMYQRFSTAHGRPVSEDSSTFPDVQTVLDLPDEAFKRLGMKFKAPVLRATAHAFCEYGAKWQEMAPEALIAEVQTVPRIGPWTAGTAVSDFTGDFSLYPYGDMAVRKWASVAAPDIDWPTSEAGFAAWWRSFTLTPAELSTLTVLTLALGGARGTELPTN